MWIKEPFWDVLETILIGNTLNDTIGAKQENVAFFAVSYRFQIQLFWLLIIAFAIVPAYIPIRLLVCIEKTVYYTNQ